MRGKIVLGVLSFLFAVSLILTVLLLNVTPVQLKRQTFTFQMNDELPTDASYFVNASENILVDCELHTEEVNTSIIATYPGYVSYKGKRFDFQVMIEDNEKPIVSVKNSSVVECFVGEIIVASDLVNIEDDTLTTVYFEANVEGESDSERLVMKKEGVFEYYVYAKDSAGNISRKVRIRFEVGLDTTKPTITGVDDKTLKVGDKFDPYEGVKAMDNGDDITSLIIVSGEVNTSLVGQYRLTYTVSDVSGNTTTITRLITVTQSGTLGQVDVGDGPFLTEDQVKKRDDIVNSLLKSELDYFDDRTFLEHLNSYLMRNYRISTSKNDESSYSVLVLNRGTRHALARAIKVILDARGMENVIVEGTGSVPVWNIVKIDNKFYHLDVYANYRASDEIKCFLLKTSELEESYKYEVSSYPKCD